MLCCGLRIALQLLRFEEGAFMRFREILLFGLSASFLFVSCGESQDLTTPPAPVPQPNPTDTPPNPPRVPPVPPVPPAPAARCFELGPRSVVRNDQVELYVSIDAAAYPRHVISGLGARFRDSDVVTLFIRTRELLRSGQLDMSDHVDVVAGDANPNSEGEVFFELGQHQFLNGVGMAPDHNGDDLAFLLQRAGQLRSDGTVAGTRCGASKGAPMLCAPTLLPPPNLGGYDEHMGLVRSAITGFGARVSDDEMNGFKVESAPINTIECP
jgi:hypothetical protein